MKNGPEWREIKDYVDKGIWDSMFWWNLLYLKKTLKTISESLTSIMENLQRKNEISRDSKTANTVSVFLKD